MIGFGSFVVILLPCDFGFPTLLFSDFVILVWVLIWLPVGLALVPDLVGCGFVFVCGFWYKYKFY